MIRRRPHAHTARLVARYQPTRLRRWLQKLTESQQPRTIVLAVATLFAVYFVLRTLGIPPFGPGADLFVALSGAQKSPQICKITQRFEPINELYEASLRSHEEHDRQYKYGMKVLRVQTVETFYTRQAHLLSVIVEELQKPLKERVDWFVWFDSDVILLNPQIPLEIFLPPRDFARMHVLATHDEHGFDGGMFFIHVHPWSVRMLIDVLSHSKNDEDIMAASRKDHKAFEITLRSDAYRDDVVYQPRWWYNTYPRDIVSGQKEGELLIHFNEAGGDKWSGMANQLDDLSRSSSSHNVPLVRTQYPASIDDYWNRMREAHAVVLQAAPKSDDEAVVDAVRRVQYAATYEADRDDGDILKRAINTLKMAIGLIDGGDIL